MSKPIIIYAPQGAGKSTHAELLRQAYGATRVAGLIFEAEVGRASP